ICFCLHGLLHGEGYSEMEAVLHLSPAVPFVGEYAWRFYSRTVFYKRSLWRRAGKRVVFQEGKPWLEEPCAFRRKRCSELRGARNKPGGIRILDRHNQGFFLARDEKHKGNHNGVYEHMGFYFDEAGDFKIQICRVCHAFHAPLVYL